MRVVGGWLVATAAVCSGLVARRSTEMRMEAVARACHELRGPLAAARLGLELGVRVGELSPAQLRALDLELGRASLALDDLAAAGLSARDGRARHEVDVAELLGDSVEAWRVPAAARGAALAFEWTGGSGARVGRAAAARPGHREPDRQRDRARRRGDQRSWFARARASPCAHRGCRRRPGIAGAGRGPGAPPPRRTRGSRSRAGDRRDDRARPRWPARGGAVRARRPARARAARRRLTLRSSTGYIGTRSQRSIQCPRPVPPRAGT